MMMYVVQRSNDDGHTWRAETRASNNDAPLAFGTKRVACEHSATLNRLHKFSSPPIKFRVIRVKD